MCVCATCVRGGWFSLDDYRGKPGGFSGGWVCSAGTFRGVDSDVTSATDVDGTRTHNGRRVTASPGR